MLANVGSWSPYYGAFETVGFFWTTMSAPKISWHFPHEKWPNIGGMYTSNFQVPAPNTTSSWLHIWFIYVYVYVYIYVCIYIYTVYIYIIYMCIPSYIPMNVSWNPNVYRLNSIFRYSQISGRLSPMPGSSSRPWSTGWDGAWCISSSGCRWRAPTARVWTTLGDCVTGAASHKSQGERRIPSGNLT